jgi:hypothetical protein
VIHQQLNYFQAAFVRRAMQRRAAFVVGDVGIDAEIEAHLDGLDVFLRRPFERHAFHPANARCDRKRRHIVRGENLRIGAVREQQFHQLDIARLRRAQKRCCAVFEQPLHGEVGSRLGAVARSIPRASIPRRRYARSRSRLWRSAA